MSNTVVRARGLTKRYRNTVALDQVDFDLAAGRIIGLIGPNGAGKTTALKAMLGLTRFDGELKVLGHDPVKERHKLMQDVCFIADVAVLPAWVRVREVLTFVEGVHERFSREQAEKFLSATKIKPDSKVKELSKGMIAQLHLAVVMAIDAKLLVLDEPTLGLDILFRKRFYENLLNDYFDGQRTILVTTHQVEEIEHILTDLMFIQHGKVVLNAAMDDIEQRFAEVRVEPAMDERARGLGPIHERKVFGKSIMLFDGVPRGQLEPLGEIRRPSVADLFVATMQAGETYDQEAA